MSRGQFGRRFDTWKYRPSGGQDIPVAVYVCGTKFTAVNTEFDIEEKGSDLDVLKTKVFKELREKLSVKWEPYLVVKFNSNFLQ